MKVLTWPTILAAALFSGTVVIPFQPWITDRATEFALEATMTSNVGGEVELYYDTGVGFSQTASVRVPLTAGTQPRVYRLRIPNGTYRQFRFDPNTKTSVVTITNVRVVEGTGRVIRAIGPSEFKVAHQIDSLRATPQLLVVEAAPRADDPQLLLNFAPPLELRTSQSDTVKAFGRSVLLPVLVVFGITLGFLALLAASTRPKQWVAASSGWARRYPGYAVAVVSLLAVCASDYPIVLLGKSYVSPNAGPLLLYETRPTVPGSTNTQMAAPNGADIGAAVWSHLPMSMEQHRALLNDAELPVWNRYNSCGTLLLGQGQSMFGDPLHLILVLSNGAPWAWDLKYVFAKWFLAVGLGLTVLTVTRHLPAAMIISLAAPFIGFFSYRFNHPAFISFCYAPAVLLCWARIAATVRLRPILGWVAGLILANIALMNSGTVKEAYVLLLCMNFSGVCLLLNDDGSWQSRLRRLALTMGGGVIFILLTTPVWLTFLNCLRLAFTVYNNPTAFQIQPGLLIGLFDEIFYRGLTAEKYVFNPSANFLILGGVLYYLGTLRHASHQTIALGLSALVPLSIAFGFIPPTVIAKVPFLGNIVHVDNSFSCGLIILLGVLAGAGFKNAAQRLGTKDGPFDLGVAGLLLFSLIFGFEGFRQAVHRQALGNTFSPIHSGREIAVDSFTGCYFAAILLALIGLGAIARTALKRREFSVTNGILMSLCALTLLWRLGLHAETVGPGMGPYVYKPADRADLHSPSPSIEFVQSASRLEPFRVIGLDDTLMPGWSVTYGLESTSGPDPLINPYYRELTTLPHTGLELFWTWRMYLRSTDIVQGLRFLDFLNVRYYLGSNRNEANETSTFRLVKRDDLNVYESRSVWPRAFFTDRVTSYDQPESFLATILAEGDRPFAAALTTDPTSKIARTTLPSDLSGREIVAARDYELSSNRTAFSINVDRPGVIVLHETYWPGETTAELNGKKIPIMRVNHAFQGILVKEPGNYRVVFDYRPKHFTISLLASAVGMGLLLLLLVSAWKIDRTRIIV